MKILIKMLIGVTALLLCAGVISRAAQNGPATKQPAKPRRDYPVKPVPFTAVHLNDEFWAPRIEINRTVTIPFAFQKCEETGRVENFNRAAGRNPRSINDQAEPRSSDDPSNTYFHWWPRKGTMEWVEYAFEKSTTVSEAEVYWFDDTGHGECRVPGSWRVLYGDGDQWKPVENREAYGVEKDRYNKITFKPVTTAALRLEVSLQAGRSAGIQEWKAK